MRGLGTRKYDNGSRNLEWLYWRGPAVNYCSALFSSLYSSSTFDGLGPLVWSHLRINLKIMNLTVGRTPWTVGQFVTRLPLKQDNTEENRTDFHASGGIRTHDPREDISCIILHGHCDGRYSVFKWLITGKYSARISLMEGIPPFLDCYLTILPVSKLYRVGW
jgi:hypothetical protein